MRKRFLTLMLAFVLPFGIVGAIVLPAQPAEAAVSTSICNSLDSTDFSPIGVYNVSHTYYYVVHHGECSPSKANGNDEILVDTCPPQANGPIAGYWIKAEAGYGQFHTGCNRDSNPPPYNGHVYYKLKH